MMPLGLLDRARKMMRGRPAMASSRPRAYRVTCPEGHVLLGHRTDGYQATRCPTCDEAVFILPRSPLPEPVAPRSSRRPTVAVDDEPKAPEPMPIEAEIEWVDEAVPEATVPAAPRPVPASPKAVKPAAIEPEPAAVPPGMIAVEERPSFAEWVGRRKNPLILAGVAVVVVATVVVRVRQRRLEDLPRVAEIGRVEGLAKLDAGDFAAAKPILAEAAAAVRALGGQVEGADAILGGAAEAALFADLVGETLEDLLEKAATYNPPDAWPSHFEAVYKGRSVIIEAPIVAVPAPNEPGSGYAIEYEVAFGHGLAPAGRGRVDLTGFRLIELARPKLGDVVTFGARLAAVRFDAASNGYLFALEPDSGAFITHARALASLRSWPSGDRADDDRGP